LDRFQNRDFALVDDIRKELYPRSYEQQIPADVCLVNRLGKELAVHYRRPPKRRFADLSEAQAATVDRFYRALSLDSRLHELSESLVIQRSACLVFVPLPGQQRYTAQVFLPWEWEADVDPTDYANPDSVKEWRFRVCIGAKGESRNFGTLRINKKEAWYEGGGLNKKTGVFRTDGANPLNGYPIAFFSMGNPQTGFLEPEAPRDLMHAQICLGLTLSDSHAVGRFNSHGWKVLYSQRKETVKEVVAGPDRVIPLHDPETEKLEILSPTTNLDQYLNVSHRFVELMSAFNDIAPTSLLKSGAITAVAKAMDAADRDSSRSDALNALRLGESRLFRVVLRLLRWNWGAGGTWPENAPRVEITYNENPTMPIADPLHESQALQMRIDMGLTNPVEVIARERDVSIEEATEILERNRELSTRTRGELEDTSGSLRGWRAHMSVDREETEETDEGDNGV
jgi:hypothetical protein